MNKIIPFCLLAGVLALSACHSKREEKPSVLVQTQLMQQKTLERTVSTFGTLNANTNATTTVSVSRAVQVQSINVTTGEAVKKGKTLLTLATASMDTSSYQQAVAEQTAAQKNLDRTQRLFTLQLATQSDLETAKKSLMAATGNLAMLTAQGAGLAQQQITAPYDGLVLSVSVKPGDRIAANTALLELAPQNGLTAQLGVRPEDRNKLKTGMQVELHSVFDGQEDAWGTIQSIASIVDPITRLIPVAVSIDRVDTMPLLGGLAINAEIILESQKSWVVSRSAVLHDEKGYYIYQIRQQKAHRVDIIPGIETAKMIAIDGEFNPKEAVVVLGNYELEEGMAVREAAAS